MHAYARFAVLTLGAALPLAAQNPAAPAPTPQACTAGDLPRAAAIASVLEAQLHRTGVPEGAEAVPPRVAVLLAKFDDALALTAEAVFRCATAATSATEIEASLAEALHANNNAATAAPLETRNHQEIGAYGADLAVQVFQLFGKPRIFEIDFRYGLECGDNNLLLVFENPLETATSGWRETLRWGAPHLTDVGGALGDFILLTPLTGSYAHPVWRYLVAHGRPGCAPTPSPSRFALDLLTPGPEAAQPVLGWHFEAPYSQGNTVPRLASTEDTIEFRLEPAANPPGGAEAENKGQSSVAVSPATSAAPQVFRFQLNSAGQVVPAKAAPTPASGDPAAP